MPFQIRWKSSTLNDLEGQYSSRNCIGCSATFLATAGLFLFIAQLFFDDAALRIVRCLSVCLSCKQNSEIVSQRYWRPRPRRRNCDNKISLIHSLLQWLTQPGHPFVVEQMSTGESWNVKWHTARCTSPVFVVSPNSCLAGWELRSMVQKGNTL